MGIWTTTCFVERCLSFCPFSFGHCVVYPTSSKDFDYPFGIFKLFLSYLFQFYLTLCKQAIFFYLYPKVFNLAVSGRLLYTLSTTSDIAG